MEAVPFFLKDLVPANQPSLRGSSRSYSYRAAKRFLRALLMRPASPGASVEGFTPVSGRLELFQRVVASMATCEPFENPKLTLPLRSPAAAALVLDVTVYSLGLASVAIGLGGRFFMVIFGLF